MSARPWWFPVCLIVLSMLLLQVVGPEWLRYDSRLMREGQWWRFLTAHWVHANWVHFLLNSSGFVLCAVLTAVRWTLWQWSWRIVFLSAAISAGLYLWQPQLGWYVGFSGVLFGLFVVAATASLSEQGVMSGILLGFIALKIGLEQYSSVNITSSDLIGIPVLVDAHLYGVLSAVFLVIAEWLFKQMNFFVLKLIKQVKHD